MTPLPAATVVPVREVGGGLEVLMVRRPDLGTFGGVHVFPGGKLDGSDQGAVAEGLIRSEGGHEDLIWRAAALRELAEEVGLFLSDLPVSPDLAAGGVYSALRSTGARLDADRLTYLSTLVTPPGLPARFDTRFYLARIGPGVQLSPAAGEVVAAEWIAPDDALGRCAAGEWPMVLPTIAHLELLVGRATVEEVLERLPDPADISFVRRSGAC